METHACRTALKLGMCQTSLWEGLIWTEWDDFFNIETFELSFLCLNECGMNLLTVKMATTQKSQNIERTGVFNPLPSSYSLNKS